MTFDYIKIGLWYRPIIPVTLELRGKELRYLALIDSGADFNIFHNEIADILKIDLSKGKKVPFQGISGIESNGVFAEVNLDLKGVMIPKTLVLFSDSISKDGYGILGQQGFFNNFKVAFDYASKKIEIKTNRKSKN